MKKNTLITIILLLPALMMFSCKKGNENRSHPVLSSNKAVINFLPEGGLDSVIITSSVRWKFTSNVNWLQLSSDSGDAGKTTVFIRALVNPANLSLTTTITVSSLEAPLPPVSLIINQGNDLKISGFTNRSARGGDILNIYGRGFSPLPMENTVTINGSIATVQTASNTNLSVIVPSKAGSGPVIVSAENKADTSDIDFIYQWVGVVSIVAGGTQGDKDGTGTAAQFYRPDRIAFDGNNNLYVADYDNSKVRKITPAGVVTTLAGRIPSYTDPTGPNTDYDLPGGISSLPGGGLAIVEFNGNTITKFTAPDHVSVIAGGSPGGFQNGIGTAALFNRPVDLAVDASGNIFVADKDNYCIREITHDSVVTTFAGGHWGYEDGPGTSARFNRPMGIDIDAARNLYVTDYYNNRIRKISPAGMVTTFAGTGSSGSTDGEALTEAEFDNPYSICVGPNGIIYVTELDGYNKIRIIEPNGTVESIAAFVKATTGEPFQFNSINGLAIDGNGVLYVSDFYNNRICKLTYK